MGTSRYHKSFFSEHVIEMNCSPFWGTVHLRDSRDICGLSRLSLCGGLWPDQTSEHFDWATCVVFVAESRIFNLRSCFYISGNICLMAMWLFILSEQICGFIVSDKSSVNLHNCISDLYDISDRCTCINWERRSMVICVSLFEGDRIQYRVIIN